MGQVYITDSGNHRIQVFNANGNFITKWGSEGSGDGQFIYPYGITVDSNKRVYVTDTENNHIQIFDSNGIFITKWGSEGSGNGQFSHPSGITVNNWGDYYVLDTYNYRVQVFKSNGLIFSSSFSMLGNTPGQINNPRDIAIDSTTRHIYVTDNGNKRINIYNRSTPPTIILQDATNNSAVMVNSTLDFDIFDMDSDPFTCFYNWNSGTNRSLTFPWNVSAPSSDGWANVNIFTNDSYGASLSKHYRFYIDVAPYISLVTPSNDSHIISTVLINLTISDYNLNQTWYHWDFESNQTLTDPWDVTVPSTEGSHWLYIYSIDDFGQTTRVKFRWLIHQVPTISLSSPTNGSIQIQGNIIVLLIEDNNLDSTWYNWDSSSNQSFSTSWNVTISLNSGWHRLTVYANDTDGYITIDEYYFYVLNPLSIEITQSPPTTSYVGESFLFSFTITNPETITLELKVYIFSSDVEVLPGTSYGNGSVCEINPEQSQKITIKISPKHASIIQFSIALYLDSGHEFHRFSSQFNVEPQWMSPNFLLPLMIILILFLLLIVMFIFVKISGKSRRYNKSISYLKSEVDRKGSFDIEQARKIVSKKDLQRFQMEKSDQYFVIDNEIVGSQYLRDHLNQLILKEEVGTVSLLAGRVGIDQTTIITLLQDLPEIKISSDQALFSDKYLQTWLDHQLEGKISLDLESLAAKKRLTKQAIVSAAKKDENSIVSQDQKLLVSANQLKQFLKDQLTSINQIDLHAVAADFNVSVDDLLRILKADSGFLLQQNRYLITLEEVAKNLQSTIDKDGKVVLTTFLREIQIEGVPKNFLRDFISKERLQGINTSDWEIFLSEQFIRTIIRDLTTRYADIEFTTIADHLGIPVSYLEEILSAILDINLVVGLIDRTNKKFIVREIPLSIAEQMISGHIFSIKHLKQAYNQSLEASLSNLQKRLPSNTYALIREKETISITQISPSCQICGTSTISEHFIKCEECGRDLCWNHFEELGTVGRAVCPYCDGSLAFLPKSCEKCHIDYIRMSKSKDACEFCGYPLRAKDHLVQSYQQFLTIQKIPLKPKKPDDEFSKDFRAEKS